MNKNTHWVVDQLLQLNIITLTRNVDRHSCSPHLFADWGAITSHGRLLPINIPGIICLLKNRCNAHSDKLVSRPLERVLLAIRIYLLDLVICWVLVIDHGIHLENCLFLQITVRRHHSQVPDELRQRCSDNPWISIIRPGQRPHADGISKLVHLDDIRNILGLTPYIADTTNGT